MTTKTKLILALILVVTIGSMVGYGLVARNRGVVGVQAGKAVRQDLTQTVTANGEIKPKKYVNISSNMMGRIVHMPVKEGDPPRTPEISLGACQHRAAKMTDAPIIEKADVAG